MEDSDKEWSKVIKHFSEKVPPHADVRCEVGYTKSIVSRDAEGYLHD